MSLPDLINGCFELFGSAAVFLSCLKVRKDKKVAGVSILTVAFFTSWGLWNIYYYPYLGQVWSSIAAGAVCVANLYWVSLLIKYRKR